MKKIKSVFFAVFLAGLIWGDSAPANADPTTALAVSNATTNRIKGVSEFLLDRAMDNYIYILATQIEENKVLQCYFPNTYRFAIGGRENFKLLLLSRDLWKRSVEKDLNALAARQLYLALSQAGISRTEGLLRDNYLKLMGQISLNYQGKIYPLNAIPVDAPPELRDRINSFWASFNKATAVLKTLGLEVQGKATGCVFSGTSFDTFKQSLDRIDAAFTLTLEQIKIIQEQRAELVFAPLAESDLGTASLDDTIAPLLEIKNLAAIAGAQQLEAAEVEVEKKTEGFLVRTMEVEMIIRSSIEQGVNPLGIDPEGRVYSQFRRYIIAFAALADAESPESVKVVLQELTLPPVSFGMKRESGENNLLISAYFGFAAGMEGRDSQSDSTFSGLFVPLGIEYSHGVSYGSWSLLVAPFDFAHPINLELEDKQESLEIKDIIRPGVYFSYGLQKYPVSVGVGASRGRALRTESAHETQYSLFLAVDMPLLRIY